MGTVPIGTGELRRIHSRVSWMFRPVERSMTVSAPHRVAQVIFSTSSSIEERDGRVADVGVDLDEELAADGHRLGLRMVDVGRNDRPAARDLVAHELGRHVLADRDELHLARDLALLRVVHLGDVAPPAQGLARPREREGGGVLVRRGDTRVVRPARQDPGTAQLRQPALQVDRRRRVRVRPRRVVDAKRGVDLRLAPHPARGRFSAISRNGTRIPPGPGT